MLFAPGPQISAAGFAFVVLLLLLQHTKGEDLFLGLFAAITVNNLGLRAAVSTRAGFGFVIAVDDALTVTVR